MFIYPVFPFSKLNVVSEKKTYSHESNSFERSSVTLLLK